MKRLALVFLTVFAACGDNLKPTPVDMAYDVHVTRLEDSCDWPDLPEGQIARLDVQLRADGTMRLTGYVSGLQVQPSFVPFRIDDGVVDADVRTAYGEAYRLSGTLTMDALDLTVDAPAYRADGSGTACRQRMRLAGPARGFRDPVSLDGAYPLVTSYFGVVCGADPVPSAPLGTGLYRVDARPVEAELRLALENSFWFQGPLPDGAGQIDWNGTFYLLGEQGIAEVPGTFKGAFAPDAVQAALEFSDPSLSSGCRHHYEMSGGKQVASLEAAGGHYRGVYRTYDTCAEEDESYAYEYDAELVPWHDGRMAVYEANGAYLVDRDGDALSASGGSEADGEIVTFTGDATPPYLKFTFDDSIRIADGSWCSYGWEFDAVKRYFPEQPWTPAFQPDPPEDVLSSFRRSSSAPSFVERASLGPPSLP